jgi:GTPase SAR1 family protein
MKKEKENENYSDYDYYIRIAILGNSKVGKTSLALQFVQNEFSHLKSVHVPDNLKISLIYKNKKIHLTVNHLYLDSKIDGIILMYDTTDLNSFYDLEAKIHTLSEEKKYFSKIHNKILVGSKNEKFNREVSYEDGKEFANRINTKFYETSSILNYNTDLIFYDLIDQIFQNNAIN